MSKTGVRTRFPNIHTPPRAAGVSEVCSDNAVATPAPSAKEIFGVDRNSGVAAARTPQYLGTNCRREPTPYATRASQIFVAWGRVLGPVPWVPDPGPGFPTQEVRKMQNPKSIKSSKRRF